MRAEARVASIVEPIRFASQTPSSGTQSKSSLSLRQLTTRFATFVVLASSGLIWDLWSKWSVFDQVPINGRSPVWNGTIAGLGVRFDLATTFNHGALWGIGQNQTWLFALFSFVAVAVILYFLWTKQAVASWWLTIATGLLMAGTLGNLYDRLGLHGWKTDNGPVYAVRDFLDFIFCDGAFHWATFNFADTYLVTGAIMLALVSFSGSGGEAKAESAAR